MIIFVKWCDSQKIEVDFQSKQTPLVWRMSLGGPQKDSAICHENLKLNVQPAYGRDSGTNTSTLAGSLSRRLESTQKQPGEGNFPAKAESCELCRRVTRFCELDSFCPKESHQHSRRERTRMCRERSELFTITPVIVSICIVYRRTPQLWPWACRASQPRNEGRR